MNYSSFKYLIKQGWHNMFANRLMTLASVGVLTACLIITGVAGLLSANVNSFVDYLGDQNEVILYLQDTITDQQRQDLEAAFTAENNVERFYYVSKEDALQEQMNTLEEYGELIAGYAGSENPLPASYRITVGDLSRVGDTVALFSQKAGVDTIGSATDLVSVLLGLKKTVNVAGWGLVAALGLVSIVVISNTIRLTVFARRKEINIMKFVGATNSFIRLPFFVEGMTVGLIAALLAFGLVTGAYFGVLSFMSGEGSWLSATYLHLLPYSRVWYWLLGGFAGGGILIGGLGSSLSMNKYLKV